jgi:hypothetical protein
MDVMSILYVLASRHFVNVSQEAFELRARVKTTAQQGSKQYNMHPPHASAVCTCWVRILPSLSSSSLFIESMMVIMRLNRRMPSCSDPGGIISAIPGIMPITLPARQTAIRHKGQAIRVECGPAMYVHVTHICPC